MNLEVANTILAQLGSGRFKAMTGAKDFVGGENYLLFGIPRSNNIRKVKIILTPMDTYTMEFYSLRGIDLKLVSRHEDVYCEQLQDIFTSETGLYTHL